MPFRSGSSSAALTVAVIAAAFVTLLLWSIPVQAQDEKELGWKFNSSLSWVIVGGNSVSRTWGLGAKLERIWINSKLKLEAGGTRAESTLKERTAFGTSPSSFTIQEIETTDKTAELYFARGRYDRDLSKRFFLFGAADWMRNQFSGIDSRTLFAAGAGNIWVDGEVLSFKTDYSATYTFEDNVVPNPEFNKHFFGARFGYDLMWVLTATTKWESDFILDWNLDNTEDVRIDFTNSLPISISERLELTPSLKLLWRNDPALTEIEILDPNTLQPVGTTTVPLEELDTFFTVALVVKI